MSVVLSPEALDDLRRIREFTGQENPEAANRIAVQIVAACDRLEYLPERGRPGLIVGTRELAIMRPYVIVYRVVEEKVQVARIWHGAQSRDD